MTADPDTYSLDWLREQLSLMQRWRKSLRPQDGDTRLAIAIARHEAWLTARLSELSEQKQAA